MKKIITTIIILLVMYFIVDRMGGMAIRWAYNQSATDAKLKTIVEKIEVEIVLMGSSKTEDHFIPQVFEDSLGMSTYNCGLVGCMDIYYQYALLNLMLERYTPKIVLLEIGNKTGVDRPQRLAALAPYLGLSSQTDSVFRDFGQYNEYILSYCYRYNMNFMNTIGWLGKQIVDDTNKGFVCQTVADYTLKKGDFLDIQVCEKALRYFEMYIKRCKECGVFLVVYIPPYFADSNKNLYVSYMSIMKEYNIPFWDYQTPGFYLDHPEYWHDELHMSGKGADVFSSKIAHDLKDLLNDIK